MKDLSYFSLKLAAMQLGQEMSETLALFNGNLQARKRVWESKQKNWLAMLNQGFGEVQERPDIWYPVDNQHFMNLTSSEVWLAEMDGYSIFDLPIESEVLWAEKVDSNGIPIPLVEYEETGSNEPGAIAEIMNLFSPEFGPYNFQVNLDLEVAQELIASGVPVLDSFRWAQDTQDYNTLTGECGEPSTIGYDPVVEDQGFLTDRDMTRGKADFEDSWYGETNLRKEFERNGPPGICFDRVRYMQDEATQRTFRFIKELNFIASASTVELKKRYGWSKDPSKAGTFWKLLYSKHCNNPEPGLLWLSKSHTILISFAFRRKLGSHVSDSLFNTAVRAVDNIKAQMVDLLAVDTFNLADIEGHVNGYTDYFIQLGKYYSNRG